MSYQRCIAPLRPAQVAAASSWLCSLHGTEWFSANPTECSNTRAQVGRTTTTMSFACHLIAQGHEVTWCALSVVQELQQWLACMR